MTETDNRLNIAREFRAARAAMKISQQELADKIGSSRLTISNIENDHLEGVKYVTLDKIAKALGFKCVKYVLVKSNGEVLS